MTPNILECCFEKNVLKWNLKNIIEKGNCKQLCKFEFFGFPLFRNFLPKILFEHYFNLFGIRIKFCVF